MVHPIGRDLILTESESLILTFYQVQLSAYAADNLLVAPPFNWVVRKEADAILTSPGCRAIGIYSCHRKRGLAENDDLLDEVFCWLTLLEADDIVPHTDGLQLSLFSGGINTRYLSCSKENFKTCGDFCSTCCIKDFSTPVLSSFDSAFLYNVLNISDLSPSNPGRQRCGC